MSTPHPTLSQLSTYAHNFTHNLTHSVSHLTLHDYIRLVIIGGAYCLLRPYLLQLSARFQASDHDRELDEDEMSSAAAVRPDRLRGRGVVVEDSSEEEGEGNGRRGTAVDWGKKARRRQRRLVRGILEAEEKLRRAEEEADSDREIEEFLVE